MNTSNEECSICIEPFNRTNRKQITCSHCDLNCCTLCTKTYLECSSVSPQCMKCHRPWSHQHIRENFGPAFVKKLSDIQKDVLFAEQLTLIPYTQTYVNLQEEHEDLKEKEKILNDEMLSLTAKRSALFSKLRKETIKKHRKCIVLPTKLKELTENRRLKELGKPYVPTSEDEEMLLDLTEQYKEAEMEKYTTNMDKHAIIRRMLAISEPERQSRYRNNPNAATFMNSSKNSTKAYIKPCGKNECKGYVNKSDNTCELCKTEYCPRCMEEKCEGHVCKEEDVQTVKLLRKDTKNCPSCATLIHRISGCPDMFCVNCNTAFNWNTMEINKRGNSNPHYYEWLRRNGGGDRNASANPNDECGIRELYTYDMTRATVYRDLTDEQQRTANTILQRLHHFENRYNINSLYKSVHKTRSNDFHIISLSYRADYMRNKSSEKNFKQLLLRSSKAKEYNNNIAEILSSIREFRQCLLRNIVYFNPARNPDRNTFDFDAFVEEATNFVKYINECVSHLELVFYNKKKTDDFIQIVW